MAEEAPVYLMADQIFDRIVGKYPQPEWVVLNEVRDGTGYSARGREADAMAFGVWPSRGLQIIGFEIKSSRGDWLREMKDPAKAESIAQHCDQWFLVTCGGVAKLEEIPAAWGWYEANTKGLKLMKPATDLAPKEIGRSFLMSIVRNISRGYVPQSQVKKLVEAETEVAMKRKRETNAYRLEHLEELSKRVEQFEKASGINLDNEYKFPAMEVGEIVKAVLEFRLDHHVADIASAAKKAGEVLTALRDLPAFKKIMEKRMDLAG